MSRGRAGLAVALLTLAAWDAQPVDGVSVPGPARPPARLSETGLYADPGMLTVDPLNRPFVPQYPLWSDGAVKARWIRLPEGATIDATDIDAWRFPAGTKLWKEFSFSGRRVETRMLWKTSEHDWIFAAYVWNEAQTNADLAPESGIPDHVEVASGKRH